jgi:peptidoglycan/LPS O-acetylase OafA/YrhL
MTAMTPTGGPHVSQEASQDRPQAEGAIPGPGRHLPALDGLRGLAVLLVVVFHIYLAEPLPAQPIPRLLNTATRIGQTGVDLFFVLSGFLITGILYDTKSSSRYFLNFYGRRTLRIFPLYYGVLLAAFVLLPRFFGYREAGEGSVWLWTYTTNLPASFTTDWGPFGHFWSLAIEEQFYLVWPLVVYAFRRETLLRVCLGCVALAVVARLVAESSGFSVYTFTLCRLDSLTVGAWIALAARGPRGMTDWPRRALRWAAVCAAALAPLYLVQSQVGGSWVQVVKYTIKAFLYGALLVIAVRARRGSWAGRFFHLGPLRALGKYSYGLYVYHPFLVTLVGRHFLPGPLSPGLMAVKLSLIFGASCAAAWLSWHLYEKHFLILKKYFEYGRAAGEHRAPSVQPVA